MTLIRLSNGEYSYISNDPDFQKVVKKIRDNKSLEARVMKDPIERISQLNDNLDGVKYRGMGPQIDESYKLFIQRELRKRCQEVKDVLFLHDTQVAIVFRSSDRVTKIYQFPFPYKALVDELGGVL